MDGKVVPLALVEKLIGEKDAIYVGILKKEAIVQYFILKESTGGMTWWNNRWSVLSSRSQGHQWRKEKVIGLTHLATDTYYTKLMGLEKMTVLWLA